MAFVEIMVFLLFLIMVYVAYLIRKGTATPEPRAFGQIMSDLGALRATLEGWLKKESEEKAKRDEEIKEERDGLEKRLSEILGIMSGTAKRGAVGEEVLQNYLSVGLKTSMIVKDLNIGSDRVEFAYALPGGKHIPIDSKLPNVERFIWEFTESQDIEEQKELKRKMLNEMKKHVKEVSKYRNKANTIDKAILAVPDPLFDFTSELNADIQNTGVIISSYSDVFFFCHLLGEMYRKLTEAGEAGSLQQQIEELVSILNQIENKTDTIDRGIKMIDGANRDIRISSIESKKFEKRGKTATTTEHQKA